MIRHTTLFDAVIACQQEQQNALDHLTIVAECLDHISRILVQIERAPDRCPEYCAAIDNVRSSLNDIDEALHNVYLSSLETELNTLRFVIEKIIKGVQP